MVQEISDSLAPDLIHPALSKQIIIIDDLKGTMVISSWCARAIVQRLPFIFDEN